MYETFVHVSCGPIFGMGIIGKAGVGKSTTISSIFGSDLVSCSILACKLLMAYYFRQLLESANMANMTLTLHLGTQINPDS